MLAIGEEIIKTSNYLSGLTAQGLLALLVVVFATCVLYFLKRMLKEAEEVKAEAKEMRKELHLLNDKHMDTLQRTALVLAENAFEVTAFGKQVTVALDTASSTTRGITIAITENTDATKLQVKSNEATTSALVDVKTQAAQIASDQRRQAETSDAVIRRNTEALEEKQRRKPNA